MELTDEPKVFLSLHLAIAATSASYNEYFATIKALRRVCRRFACLLSYKQNGWDFVQANIILAKRFPVEASFHAADFRYHYPAAAARVLDFDWNRYLQRYSPPSVPSLSMTNNLRKFSYTCLDYEQGRVFYDLELFRRQQRDVLAVVRACTALENLHLNVSDADSTELSSAIMALPRLRILVLKGNVFRNPTYSLPELVDIVIAHIDKYDTLEEVELLGIQSDRPMHGVLRALTARERKPRLRALHITDREPCGPVNDWSPRPPHVPPVTWRVDR